MFDSFSDDFFKELRSIVKNNVDERRFDHIMAVEKKACEIASVFDPENKDAIRAAAILHDLTKCKSADENLAICAKYGYDLASDHPPKLLHALSAPLIVAAELAPEYPLLGDPKILGAIRWHTTARAHMTFPEAIVYLADYIEDTREYEECTAIREYYERGIEIDDKKNNLHFYKTMVICLRYTITHLENEKAPIDHNTVEALEYYLDLIKVSEKGTN